jgi:multicomponent Na+:H+ antiporter subunit D
VGDLLFHPALPLGVAALVCFVVPMVVRDVLLADRVTKGLIVAAPVVALVQLATLPDGASVPATFHVFDLEVMRADGLATAFGWVFAIAALLAGTFGLATQTPRERSAALAYAGAAMGVVFAGDLLTFFVAWEIKAISSTFLILNRGSRDSGRAGMRYLFVHVLGGKLLLAGVLWHYADTGSLAFTAFEPSPATVLILLACAVSAAIPPLHAWLPDAYPRATVAGTVFLSAYTTKAAVYALARGFAGWEVLLWIGVAMTLYGVTFAILENDIRRLLGFHIVSQVGFMVAAVGIGTELAINGATAHAFAHILYKGLLLMGTGAVLYATGRSRSSELGGIARRMRAVLVLYMIGAVSISSLPLFSGFVSKEMAVQSVSYAGYSGLVVLLKIASVGTFLSTGLKLPYSTWFGAQGAGPATNEGARVQVGRVPVSMYVAMGGAAALNLAIGVYPELLYGLLPFDEIYEVYTLGKVVETLQLLLFTGLLFWLLLARLQAKDKLNLDTDWVYRRLPILLRDARGDDDGRTPDGHAGSTADTVGALGRARTAVLERVGAAATTRPPPVAATWLLGAIVVGAGVLFLVLSLGGGS